MRNIRTQTATYAMNLKSYVIRASVECGQPMVLGDRPHSSNSMERYFESSFEVFLVRLEQFRSLDRVLTVEEEKELSFMLEALIAAKNILGQKAK